MVSIVLILFVETASTVMRLGAELVVRLLEDFVPLVRRAKKACDEIHRAWRSDLDANSPLPSARPSDAADEQASDEVRTQATPSLPNRAGARPCDCGSEMSLEIKLRIGDAVTELRLQCGWDQATLSKRSNVPPDTIAAIEAADDPCSVDVACSLAAALGVTFEELVETRERLVH
jgi:DNA-binding XRE family transcriptional regulator